MFVKRDDYLIQSMTLMVVVERAWATALFVGQGKRLFCMRPPRIRPPDRFGTYLGSIGRIRFVEERPDLGLDFLPPGQGSLEVVLLEAELPRHLLLARLLRVQVEAVQNRQRLFGVSMLQEKAAR